MLIRTATLACAFAVSLVTAQSVSAQTQDVPAPEANCDSCSSSSFSSFGSSVQSDWDAFKRRFKLDTDRNEAWPHPFLTADRASYRAMWQPCFDRGWEIEHTLSGACFDEETGELNRLGAAKIAQLVYAAPGNRKTLYIHQDQSTELAQSRLSQVENFLRVEYGRSAGVAVAVTRNFPVTGSGAYAENISRQWQSNLPRPTLQASSITNAVNGGN